jgi:hypothetical protein
VRRFTDVLGDIAEQAKLYEVTDAAVRGARRRRRVRSVVRAGLVVVLVVGLLGGVSLVSSGMYGWFSYQVDPVPAGPGRQEGNPPALVAPLLDSAARGSLAGDAAYLQAVLDRVAHNPDDFGLPSDPSRLRILFAGDVPGNQRLVIVAGYTAAPAYVHLSGKRGAGVNRLELSGWSEVEEPLVTVGWGYGARNGYELVLGPAGYPVSTSSNPRFRADGTVQRDWQPEPAGYVVCDLSKVPPGLRMRITRDDKVWYEAPVASPGSRRTTTVDPNPLYGRGKPAPRAADAAADALAYSTGLVGPDVRYVVLWSDDFQIGSQTGQIATVMAITPDGGGPYLTLAIDAQKEPTSRLHPTGQGILGAPEQGLIVMRPPHWDAHQPDQLIVIAPTTAVRAEVARETVTLTNGVGRVTLPQPLDTTVKVVDAAGATVAERPFDDISGSAPSNAYEGVVRAW